MWTKIAYVLACLVLPLLWGVIVARLSNRIDGWAKRRRGGHDTGSPLHPDDSTRVEYHI